MDIVTQVYRLGSDLQLNILYKLFLSVQDLLLGLCYLLSQKLDIKIR